MRLIALGFLLGLYWLVAASSSISASSRSRQTAARRRRHGRGGAADILDRNGEVLATDVKAMSVFAEPRRIIDKDEATELLTAVSAESTRSELREKLGSRKGFVWVKREMTPNQQQEVYPPRPAGRRLHAENKRVYPNGAIAAHVLGFANIDNIGIAGLEKYIDGQGLADLHSAGFNLTPRRSEADLAVARSQGDLRRARRTGRRASKNSRRRPARRRSSTSTPAK